MSSDWMSLLLASGELSDFTIECQGREFHVHKLIVCSQSPVIKAALFGKFLEAKENRIKIEQFDADTVLRMLQFMYWAHDKEADQAATAPEGEEEEDNGEEAGEEAGDGDGADDGSDDSTLTESTYSHDDDDAILEKARQKLQSLTMTPTKRHRRQLTTHIWTNAIADYYQVPALCEHTRQAIGRIFHAVWSRGLFLEIVRLAVSATGDKGLHHQLAQLAVEHADELDGADDASLAELVALHGFPQRFVQGTAARVRELMNLIHTHSQLLEEQAETIKGLELTIEGLKYERDHLTAENERQTEEVKTNGGRLMECLSLLHGTRYCQQCSAEFDCFIEAPQCKSFTLRCQRCQTRQVPWGKEMQGNDTWEEDNTWE